MEALIGTGICLATLCLALVGYTVNQLRGTINAQFGEMRAYLDSLNERTVSLTQTIDTVGERLWAVAINRTPPE